MIWQTILDPKNPDLKIEDVAAHALTLGYRLFVFDGKIYQLLDEPRTEFEAPKFTETKLVPEMFMTPEIFVVMDKEEKRIAMNELGPLLFTVPLIATAMAEKLGGVAKPFRLAIYLQNKARENESPLILPPEPAGKIITP